MEEILQGAWNLEDVAHVADFVNLLQAVQSE
jgi:hypothetical protein